MKDINCRMGVWIALGLSLASLYSAAASAESITAGYRVLSADFKRNGALGTQRFELFTNSQCSGTPVASKDYEVSELLVEQLNLVRVRRGPIPPKLLMLSAEVPNVKAGPVYYLKVTGPGVKPYQTACQVQRAADGSTVPAGTIVMWSGPLAEIPPGWALCDGENGTPNLLSRFVRGISTNTEEPGQTGGSDTHRHTGTTDATTGNRGYIAAGRDDGLTTEGHRHGFTTSTASNLPPYYTLAYIIKLQ